MGEQVQEPVTQEVCERQRYAQLFACSKHKADVLMAERDSETCRLEFFPRDQIAIGLVDRRREKGRCQNLEILTLVDAALAHKRQCLAKRLDHGRNQEIAGELDEVGCPRLLGYHERPLPDSLEQRTGALDRV